jgi:hypothetical protein
MHNQGISLLYTQLNKITTGSWLLLGLPLLVDRIPIEQNQGNELVGEGIGLRYLVEYLMQGHCGLPILAWSES